MSESYCKDTQEGDPHGSGNLRHRKLQAPSPFQGPLQLLMFWSRIPNKAMVSYIPNYLKIILVVIWAVFYLQSPICAFECELRRRCKGHLTSSPGSLGFARLRALAQFGAVWPWQEFLKHCYGVRAIPYYTILYYMKIYSYTVLYTILGLPNARFISSRYRVLTSRRLEVCWETSFPIAPTIYT